MKKIIFLFIAFVAVTATSKAQSKVSPVLNLSSERFKAICENDKTVTIIDLRTTEEMQKKGFIKGAVQLDYLAKDSEKMIDKLDKNKTYCIYCAGGGRSSEAAAYMEKQGFKKVYTLEKGLGEWIQKGFPVQTK